MNDKVLKSDDLRERIIADPDLILEDRDVMRALIGASDTSLGQNIVDLRGIALDRMESRLDRLEDTHRSVIAAAYENLAGTKLIHRAILELLEPVDFKTFTDALQTDIADALRVDATRLLLETARDSDAGVVKSFSETLQMVPKGFGQKYLSGHRAGAERKVILRQIRPENAKVYGDQAEWIRSEACLRLDLGHGRLPGLLVLGSEDPHQFKPAHGTDLLAFFANVFERVLRKWLA